MSPKALRALSAAFAALAALWWGWTRFDARAGRPDRLFAAAADAVTLDGHGSQVRLVNAGGEWAVEKPFVAPADKSAVSAALGELAAARLSAPLSDDPSRLPLFGLQDSAATRLTVTGPGGARLEVLLGGSGATSSSLFLRNAGSPVVREADGMSRSRWSLRAGDWTDKTMSTLEPARVTKLTVRSPKGRVVLEGEALKRPAAAAALEALSRFQADDVLDAASLEAEPRARLDRVEFSVDVEILDYAGAPGVPAASFTVSPQGQDFRHLARLKGRDSIVYSLSGWRLDPLRLDPKDFR